MIKAILYASLKHKNQVRKSEEDKPYIVHPLYVGLILKNANLSEDLIAAGILHDTIEDTNTSLNDIDVNFNHHIASLVKSVSEEDKSLSWEERKQETINHARSMPLENKLLLCADKIANLTDLFILFNREGKRDFSHFKRGEEKHLWYHEGVYNALTLNGDTHPLFDIYKELIDKLFYEKKVIDSTLARIEEINILRQLVTLDNPLIIKTNKNMMEEVIKLIDSCGLKYSSNNEIINEYDVILIDEDNKIIKPDIELIIDSSISKEILPKLRKRYIDEIRKKY